MNNQTGLIYLKHCEIEYGKWDRCINTAPNSRVYAASWYLDRSAGIWDAMVWGEYQFVMPLPYRKKFGIKYLYQPIFCQQLGIFPSPPEEIASKFYAEIGRLFRYSDMQLNSFNPPPKVYVRKNLLPRNNFLLSLNEDYKIITEGYSKNTKRNIAKANNNKLNYISHISLEEYLEFLKNNPKAGLINKDLNILKSIIAYCQYKGCGEIQGVYTTENELCAAVFFCRWKERVIYLNATSSSEGKDSRGMFFLLDNFIRKNAGNNLMIDFEGSMISGVARFFKGFGAYPEYYYPLKFNRLPFPFRWVKRV